MTSEPLGSESSLAVSRGSSPPAASSWNSKLRGGKWPLASLSEEKQLEKLRVIGVSFARNGKPSADVAKLAIDKLSPQFPAKSYLVNKELVQLLVFLEAPGTATKTLALLEAAPTQEQAFCYLFHRR